MQDFIHNAYDIKDSSSSCFYFNVSISFDTLQMYDLVGMCNNNKKYQVIKYNFPHAF